MKSDLSDILDDKPALYVWQSAVPPSARRRRSRRSRDKGGHPSSAAQRGQTERGATAVWSSELRIEASVDANGDVTLYVYGNSVNTPELVVRGDQVYRVITDLRGSPILVVNVTRLRVVPDEDEAMAPDIKAAWQAEVRRRKQRLEAGETSTQPWEEVEAELMNL